MYTYCLYVYVCVALSCLLKEALVGWAGCFAPPPNALAFLALGLVAIGGGGSMGPPGWMGGPRACLSPFGRRLGDAAAPPLLRVEAR
jgi:hypothetical protein